MWHKSSIDASYLVSIVSVLLSLLIIVTKVSGSINTYNGIQATNVYPYRSPHPHFPQLVAAGGRLTTTLTLVLVSFHSILLPISLFSILKMQLYHTIYLHDTNILSISKGISKYSKISSSKYPIILCCLGRAHMYAIYITAQYHNVSSNYF